MKLLIARIVWYLSGSAIVYLFWWLSGKDIPSHRGEDATTFVGALALAGLATLLAGHLVFFNWYWKHRRKD